MDIYYPIYWGNGLNDAQIIVHFLAFNILSSTAVLQSIFAIHLRQDKNETDILPLTQYANHISKY